MAVAPTPYPYFHLQVSALTGYPWKIRKAHLSMCGPRPPIRQDEMSLYSIYYFTCFLEGDNYSFVQLFTIRSMITKGLCSFSIFFISFTMPVWVTVTLSPGHRCSPPLRRVEYVPTYVLLITVFGAGCPVPMCLSLACQLLNLSWHL